MIMDNKLVMNAIKRQIIVNNVNWMKLINSNALNVDLNLFYLIMNVQKNVRLDITKITHKIHV